MKKIYTLLLFISVSFGFAQDLYVDNNSFIFARDVVVFVNNDIRLETATSNFYLRGDSQLLQNVDIKNADIGHLSVYQDQTVQIYEYNYWCSPVGVGINNSVRANLPFDHSNIYRPADAATITNVTSTPYNWTTSYDATAAPNYELSERWMYKLKEAEGYGGWDYVQRTTDDVDPGYGFTLKGSPVPLGPLKTLDFRGRPNNGTIAVEINYDGTDNEPNSEPVNAASTLTGNPYPSAMDLKLFFVNSAANQSNTDGSIYFWEQVALGTHYLEQYQGGYAIYTPGNLADLNDDGSYAVATFETYDGSGGNNGDNNGTSPIFSNALNHSRRYAAIGQGFLIGSSGVNSGDAEINNSMRLYLAEDSAPTGDGSVFRDEGEDEGGIIAMSHNGVDYMDIINNPKLIPEFRVHTHINDTYYRENVVAFRDDTDLSYNKFCDAVISSVLDDDAYMMADDNKVVIKSITFDESVRIPFVLKSNQGNSTFDVTVFSRDGIDNDIQLYVYDAAFNTYTNIKSGVFSITLPEGEHADRFELTFSNQDTLSNPEVSISDFEVYQNNNTSELTILNPGGLDVKKVTLFDITGKQIFNQNVGSIQTEYRFSTKNLSDGAYVATLLVKDKQLIQKKIIIKNN